MKKLLLFALFALCCGQAPAQSVPALINYQGQLTDANGTNLPTADYILTFNIYDLASGGLLVWGPQVFDGTSSQGHGPKIPVVQGYFNVLLGSNDTAGRSLAEAFNGAARYVEIKVGANDPNPITPRQQILTAPFAFKAGEADKIAGKVPGDFVAKSGDTMTGTLNLPADGLSVGGGQITASGGNVGIGTKYPAGPLDVRPPDAPSGKGLPVIIKGQKGATGNGGGNLLLSSGDNGVDSTNGYIAFGAGATVSGSEFTTGESMRITSAGNVGIGTTSPNLSGDKRALTVSAGTTSDGIARLEVQGSRGSDDIYGSLNFYHKANNTAAIQSYRSGADDAGNLTFWTRATGTALAERLRIDNAGNVGIGTTSPTGKLDIRSDGETGPQLVVGHKSSPWVRTTIEHNGTFDMPFGNANYNFRIGGDSRLFIGNNRRFGINTETPGNNFEISEPSGGPGIRLNRPGSAALDLNWSGTNFVVSATSSFKIGIGTANPASTLDVIGAIRCTTLFQTSDRNAKENLAAVDCQGVLNRAVSIPILSWNFTNDASGGRHIGPMAQDFYAAFGVGPDDKHIATVDADGVALAAIQGLHQFVKTQQAELAAKDREIQSLSQRLAAVEAAVLGNADQKSGGSR
jgi:hypothetical protein